MFSGVIVVGARTSQGEFAELFSGVIARKDERRVEDGTYCDESCVMGVRQNITPGFWGTAGRTVLTCGEIYAQVTSGTAV